MWDSSWCAKGDAELKLMFFLLVSVGMAICFLLRGGFVCLFANGHSVLQCSEGFVVGFRCYHIFHILLGILISYPIYSHYFFLGRDYVSLLFPGRDYLDDILLSRDYFDALRDGS